MAVVMGSSGRSSSYHAVYPSQPSTRPAVKASPSILGSPKTVEKKDIAPQALQDFLGRIQNAEAGDSLETQLDPDSLSWFRTHFVEVTEMYGGKWDVIDSKVIVTIPTIIHESVLQELNRHVHTYKRAHNLQVGGSDLPVYNGVKIPDLNIFDVSDPNEDGYSVPRVSFEVAYSESWTKLLWDLVRLVLGLQGLLRLVYGLNLHSRKSLQYVEFIAFASSGMGTLHGAEIKQFQHGKVYGRNGDRPWKVVPESGPPEYECLRMLTSDDENDHTYVDCRLVGTWKMSDKEQGDIVIPGRSLFVDDEEDDIVLSGAKMWQDLKTCHGLQHGLNVWKTESRRKGGKKRKVNAFEADAKTLFLAKRREL
ncbi:hypothetical protein IW261DRAFT_1568660 [Armillaria novae-zelandiae]|uniref:Uncharacterized protein n=1 Tax=Armillaria novae-zelandiae TaxID=153914 RepID=A0AA39NYP6_9AGAR|nr:hypothetical protein IW261DRAFT_1568660 [Armillaria novae-zelandiae]